MIEVVSIYSLLRTPRFFNGGYYLTGCNWSRQDSTALLALCEHRVKIEKCAEVLGRSPSSIGWRGVDTGLHVPADWRQAIKRNRQQSDKRPLLSYPYISSVRGEHADLLAVNALVPRNFPEHMRADICQEIMVAMFMKEVTLEALKANPRLVKKFTTGFRKANLEGNGYAFSLDVPMADGRSWYDVLPDPATLDYH